MAQSSDLTTENRDIHPDDTTLRKFEFRIFSRPRDGPAIWTRHGEQFSQKEAIAIVRREMRSVELKC